MLEIRIPAPTDWINSNQRLHRMQTAKLTKAWRTASQVASKGLEPLQTPIRVVAYIWKPRNGRYDPGNLYPTAKAILDGLVDSGLIEDDDYTRVVGPDMRHGGKGSAEIVLKIREIAAISAKIESASEVLETPPEA